MKRLIYLTTCSLLALALLGSPGCLKEKKKKPTVAKFVLTCNIEGATWYINGKEQPNKLPIEPMIVKPGKFLVKVSKDGYLPQWQVVELKAGKQATADFNLTPITGTAMLTSKPKAQVEYNGKIIGETPVSLKALAIGRHKAILKRAGYVPREISWVVESPRPQKVHTSLVSNIGRLIINSTPAGANLFIDDANRGQTPFDEDIEQGQHKIRIEKGGYAVHEQIVLINRNQTTQRSIDLVILPGSVTITSKPDGAILVFNGKPCGNTPRTIKDLKPGAYPFKLSKPGCDSEDGEITVMAGQNSKIHVDLSSNTGGIDLVVNPPGVTIYLDGKKVGASKAGSNKKFSEVFTIRNISADNHVITVAHKRAQPDKKTFKVKVKKGQVTRMKTINMWIADHELILKSKKRYIGRLVMENDEGIQFEPEPGIRQHYGREEIHQLMPYKHEE